MALIQSLITSDKYSLKCPYAMTPKGICIHNTANDANAANEISYMQNNNNEVSFHIAVDDTQAIQGIPLNRNAWHAGDGGNGEGNRNYIAVEICYSKSGGDKFANAEKMAAKEVASLIKQYEWTLDNVKKHQDFNGKHCPHRTLDQGWKRFLNMIQLELDILSGKTTTITGVLYRVRKTWADAESQVGAYSDLGNAKKECDKNKGYSVFDSKGNKVYSVVVATPSTDTKPQETQSEYIIKKYSETGTFTCSVDAINFRNNPVVSSDNPTQGQYFRNEKVNYDYVVITNKYVYISWISASSGVRRYMPITDKTTGEKWGYCV